MEVPTLGMQFQPVWMHRFLQLRKKYDITSHGIGASANLALLKSPPPLSFRRGVALGK